MQFFTEHIMSIALEWLDVHSMGVALDRFDVHMIGVAYMKRTIQLHASGHTVVAVVAGVVLLQSLHLSLNDRTCAIQGLGLGVGVFTHSVDEHMYTRVDRITYAEFERAWFQPRRLRL